MGIIGWIVFGFFVGLVARAVLPGRDAMGFVATTVLGIIGAVFGGWVGQAFGWYGPNEAAGFIMATIGAVVALGLYNFAVSRRAVTKRTSSSGNDRWVA